MYKSATGKHNQYSGFLTLISLLAFVLGVLVHDLIYKPITRREPLVWLVVAILGVFFISCAVRLFQTIMQNRREHKISSPA